MLPEERQPHVEERSHPRRRDDVRAVQVQEDEADGQHLAAVAGPCGVDAVEEEDWVQLQAAAQARYLLAQVGVTLLGRGQGMQGMGR